MKIKLRRLKISSAALFSKDFILICLSNLFLCMASYAVMPVLPLYLLDIMQCPKNIMGMALAIFPLIALVFRPVSGLAADIFDCRRVLLISTSLCAIFFPLSLIAPTVLVFMAIRGAHGIAFSEMGTAQATLAVDLMPENQLGTGIGIFSSALSLGMIFGPMLGLFAASKFSYAMAFWLSGALAALGAIMQSFIGNHEKKPLQKPRRLKADMFFMPRGLSTLIVLILAAFMHGLITNYISVLARENGMESYAGSFFLLMGASVLVSRLFSGLITDRGHLAVGICACEIITLFTGFWLANVQTPAVFLLCGTILGMTLGVLPPAYQTILVRIADYDKRGVANSMYYIGMDGGICLALLTGGIIVEIFGMKGAYITGAIAQAGAIIIFLAFVRTTYGKYARDK